MNCNTRSVAGLVAEALYPSAKCCIFYNHFALEGEKWKKDRLNQMCPQYCIFFPHASTQLCYVTHHISQVSTRFASQHARASFQTLPALLAKNASNSSTPKTVVSFRTGWFRIRHFAVSTFFFCVSSISTVDIHGLLTGFWFFFFFFQGKKNCVLTLDPWSRCRTRLSPGRASWCALAMS